MSRFVLTRRFPGILRSTIKSSNSRPFVSSTSLFAKLDGDKISEITAREKEITGEDRPVKGGPTAQAQKHVGEELSSNQIADIVAKGEARITGNGQPVAGGPASMSQSNSTNVRSASIASSSKADVIQVASGGSSQQAAATGNIDSSTLSNITAAEKEITGEDGAVKGGPTAQAQKHVHEPITSKALHDITEGEKKITGGERVKGGPTATAQSELSRSRESS